MKNKNIYPAIFIVSASTVVFQILLTRVLSFTLFYHYAFIIVSLAMLGLTGGALIVFMGDKWLKKFDLDTQLAVSALGYGLTAPISIALHTSLVGLWNSNSISFILVSSCFILAVPLLFSGFFVCVALTRWPGSTGKIYAADLLGAASGCLLVVFSLASLDLLTVLLVSSGAAIFAGLLVVNEESLNTRRRCVLGLFAILILLVGQQVLQAKEASLLSFQESAIKSWFTKPIYDRWNSYSRVTIGRMSAFPFGWGLSANYPYEKVPQLWLKIDSSAGTRGGPIV